MFTAERINDDVIAAVGLYIDGFGALNVRSLCSVCSFVGDDSVDAWTCRAEALAYDHRSLREHHQPSQTGPVEQLHRHRVCSSW
jgi:hypothetical protein